MSLNPLKKHPTLDEIITDNTASRGIISSSFKSGVSERCGLGVCEIRSLDLGPVKPMTYKIYTCCFLAWRLALISLVSSVSG